MTRLSRPTAPLKAARAFLWQFLDLDSVKDRPWHICPSNALTGYGLDEGVSWISEHLQVT